MIVKQEMVKKIKDYFDLNIYETKVWLALLSRGLVSASETSDLSGVPRSRTYDVLESLAKRGFAIVRLGKPVKYIAVEPNTVIEKMKINLMVEAQDKVNNLVKLKGTPEYTELEQLHRVGITPIKPEDLSGHIRGRSNIIAKLKEIFENAKKEMSICTSVDDFENKIRAIIPALEKSNEENIKVKIALSGEEDRIKRLVNKYNLKIKQTQNTGKFFIADRSEALFMVTKDNGNDEVGVWLKSPFFSSTLSSMFDEHLKR